MKKLMIAAAIVCAAAFTQAASISWGVESGTNPYTGEDLDYYYEDPAFEAFFFVSSASLGGDSATLSYDTAKAAVKAGTFDSWASAIGASQQFEYGAAGATAVGSFNAGTKAGEVVTPNDIAAYIIIKGEDLNGKEVLYISDIANTSINDLGGAPNINFGNLNNATTAVNTTANWYQVAPEPTSGLLLLLGVAGLALRRRRA